MAIGNSRTILSFTELCLLSILVTNCCSYTVISANNNRSTECDCPGPIKFYKEIGCTPVYKNAGDCCAVTYNCDQWKNLPDAKCLLNGYLYLRGEKLREVDRNACDDCTCIGPGFFCNSIACNPKENCYMKKNTRNCCGAEVCPKREEERPTCVVDKKTYKDGEFFIPSTDPEKHCYCGEGYTGENIEPFCSSPKHTWCNTMIYHAEEIRGGCAPIYFYGESPQKDCNANFRCHHRYDRIIRRNDEPSNNRSELLTDSEPMCHHGPLRMQIGDELNTYLIGQAHDVKCVCEVPPLPTCRRTTKYMQVHDFWPSGQTRYVNDKKYAF